MCVRDGIAPRTAKEYIKALVDAELLKEAKTEKGLILIAKPTKEAK